MSETPELTLDGRRGKADAVREHAEAELARLDSVWIVLSELLIGNPPDEVVIDYVAMHPDRGIALIDLDRGDADTTAERATSRFRELLVAERFHEFFPGHLPIAHVTVPPQPGFLLQPKIDAALAAAGTPTVEPGDWANALGDLLIGPDDGESVTAAETEAQPPTAGEPSFAAITPGESENRGSTVHAAAYPEPNVGEAVRLAAERASRPIPDVAATARTSRTASPVTEGHERPQGFDAYRPMFEPTPETEALRPRRRRGWLLGATAAVALLVAGGVFGLGGINHLLPANDDGAATSDTVASAGPTAPSITLPTEAPPSQSTPSDTATADAKPPAAATPAPADTAATEPAAKPVVSEETPPRSPPSTVAVAPPSPLPAAEPAQHEEEKRTAAAAAAPAEMPPTPTPAPAAPAPAPAEPAASASAAPAPAPAVPAADTQPSGRNGEVQTPPAATAARQPERPPSVAQKAPAAEPRSRAPTRLASRPPVVEPRQAERSVAPLPLGRYSAAPPRPLTPSTATAPASSREGPPIDASDLPPLEPGAGSSSPPPPLQRPAYGDSSVSALPSLPPTVAQANTPVPVPPPAPPMGSLAGSAGAPSRTADMTDCRPYTSATSITGQERSVEGMACRLPDGRWKLVTEAPRR